MSNIKVLGIDLAKNVFQLHGANAKGKCVFKKRVSRNKLMEVVANTPPCLIGIEACTGAHHWARVFRQYGHKVKMMAPQFVKPYVKSNKNDQNDARGIAEAVTRPDMKFVPIKTIDQQAVLAIHRARELLIKQRTALSNHLRGTLAEFGIVFPKGMRCFKQLPMILEENNDKLIEPIKEIVMHLYEHFKDLDNKINFYDKKINQHVQQNTLCQEITAIEGIGPITASAIVATIGDPTVFKNGREVSAWLGLVPKQYSSGNTIRLSGISKRGDRYIRKLLVHGARSVLKTCHRKTDKKSLWWLNKKHTLGYNKAAVALANKNARIIWAMMASGECYRPSYKSLAA